MNVNFYEIIGILIVFSLIVIFLVVYGVIYSIHSDIKSLDKRISELESLSSNSPKN